jgi:Cellulose-binding Sde182, nucleoside hydrolase-like domain/Cellulose-binding protein Sde0182, C-terminal domain
MPLPRHTALVLLSALAIAAGATAQPIAPTHVDDFAGHPRLIVLSDIGNEPDDQMSLVRLLLYSNEIDIEGLVASTSTWQKTAVHPETMHTVIGAYGQVRANLLLHAKGWPAAADLDSRVFTGPLGYGMAAISLEKPSSGAEAILRAAGRDDPRPLWISLWGGANTLAEALARARSARSREDLDRLIAKLRVYSISDQDDAGPWIRREFPNLFYIVKPSPPNGDEYYYATWTGISGDVYYRNGAGASFVTVTNEWLDRNIRGKGPLGKVYPRFQFIMEGDTPSYLGLIDNGLASWRRPDWGGWGGRYLYRQPYGETHPVWTQGGDMFSRVTSQDTVTGEDGKPYTSDQATIWRWREAFQNDFAARMDWTVSDYAHANHNPVVEINGQGGTGPIAIDAEAGKPVVLDATRSSDPDGQTLHYHWFHYAEAGSTGASLAAITISEADSPKATVTATATCRPQWLARPAGGCPAEGTAHIILAVTDEGSPRLTSYRRILLNVHAPKPR